MELYLIMDGVHRSVAAREAGLSRVLATIEIDGVSQGTKLIALDQLISPKESIDRWDRGRDMLPFIDSLRTIEGRT